ncbi:MAG TPA: 50S ribosomal protein L3 [Deltaproteobacteria bacterium]|nr:50S ribosomal protein L3 [Deltaproteobacteria bacterium]
MVEGVLGRKIGMTHIYRDGVQVPVTVIDAGGNRVVQRKTVQKEGYDAVQIGFAEKKESRTNKPMRGHFKKAGKCFYHLAEMRGDGLDGLEPGREIRLDEVFKAGDYVDVTGRSKGKGFAGVVKRWKFAGGPASHGSMHGRAPGSIGQSSDSSRVFKGMRMAGHMGDRTTTVQNLEVVDVRADENLLLVKGAVPGPRNGVMIIRKALKKAPKAAG